MASPAINFDALAAQHGGQVAATPTTPAATPAAGAPIDYDALAAQHGGSVDAQATTAQLRQNLRQSGGLPSGTGGRSAMGSAGLTPPGSQPMPAPIRLAIESTPFLSGVPEVVGAAPIVARGIAAGARAALPTAGPTLEGTIANVTKWAVEKGISATGIGGAWYLLHRLLGGNSQ